MSEIAPFYAVEVARRAAELAAGGNKTFLMCIGQPSAGAPGAAVAAAHAALDREPFGYDATDGWPPLKARILQRYRDDHGVDLDPARLFVTMGASAALLLAFAAAFKPGDRVAIARPGYPAYRNILLAQGLVPVDLPCGPATRYQPSAEMIAALDPAPAGLIVASPANPTGSMLSLEDCQALAAECARRGIRLISDEIYHGLSYTGRAASALEAAPGVMVVNSFSKLYRMTGWRLGWLVTAPDLTGLTDRINQNMFIAAPSISQRAALAAMGAAEDVASHIQMYARNRALVLERLHKLGLTRHAPADGAFYVYADVSSLTSDSMVWCAKLLEETGVAFTPGLDFDPVDGRRFVRISFAISTAEVAEALDRLEMWIAGSRK